MYGKTQSVCWTVLGDNWGYCEVEVVSSSDVSPIGTGCCGVKGASPTPEGQHFTRYLGGGGGTSLATCKAKCNKDPECVAMDNGKSGCNIYITNNARTGLNNFVSTDSSTNWLKGNPATGTLSLGNVQASPGKWCVNNNFKCYAKVPTYTNAEHLKVKRGCITQKCGADWWKTTAGKACKKNKSTRSAAKGCVQESKAAGWAWTWGNNGCATCNTWCEFGSFDNLNYGGRGGGMGNSCANNDGTFPCGNEVAGDTGACHQCKCNLKAVAMLEQPVYDDEDDDDDEDEDAMLEVKAEQVPTV